MVTESRHVTEAEIQRVLDRAAERPLKAVHSLSETVGPVAAYAGWSE